MPLDSLSLNGLPSYKLHCSWLMAVAVRANFYLPADQVRSTANGGKPPKRLVVFRLSGLSKRLFVAD